MSLADTLFGSPPTTTYNTTAGTKPPGYGFANQFFNSLQNISSNPFPTYGHSLDPGLSPTLQDLIQRAQGYASSSPPSILQGAAGTYGRMLNPNLSNPITRMFGGAPDLTGRLNPNQKVFGGGPAGGMTMPGTQTTPYGNDAMSVPWAHGGSGVQSMNGGGYQSGGPPQFGGGGMQSMNGGGLQSNPVGGSSGLQSMSMPSSQGGGFMAPGQNPNAKPPMQPGFGGGPDGKFKPMDRFGGYQTPGINPMGSGFPMGRMPMNPGQPPDETVTAQWQGAPPPFGRMPMNPGAPQPQTAAQPGMMPPSPSSQMSSPTPWSAFRSPVSAPQQPGGYHGDSGFGGYQPPGASGGGLTLAQFAGQQPGGAPSPFGGSGSGSGPGMGTGTASPYGSGTFGGGAGGNAGPTQPGAPSNFVQGIGNKAWSAGNMMNRGQLDPTGTKMWAGAGGGEQGQWQNYNPADENQKAIADMFQRYGSNWASGSGSAYGHSSEMGPQFQALMGREGTPQELNDLYYGANPGQQKAAYDAFSNQSAAYNPASGSYNPAAGQNLTALNPLAHQ